ncbi:type II secretion system F family protein [Pyrobaculum aerophilum]|uniref:Secretion system protein n=1 Tax=Pyrobaculum aerophilum TaxID=13773 RepID=A0A371QY81_9CREN|nr:type II secretion system F family protein [Pyrobaculum aerophilum]RFA95566.1 secretion system protein [Pyrobaculum aerophilum]RFA98276.1 secretion system protein [Pyrobaculum aerophilum]
MAVFELLYDWAFAVGVATGVLLVAVGLPAWRRSVFIYRLEGQIPQVLRVLSDAAAAGLDLKSAVEASASLALRPMAQVLRRVLSLTEMGGLTVEEAFWQVAKEVPSADFRRFALILIEAARSGARLPEVLNVAARSFATVVEFRQSVASQLRPYVALFYAVMVVYAVLADVLVYFLLPQLAKFTPPQAPVGGIQPYLLSRDTALRVLLISGGVGGVIGGLVVGRVVYGVARAGLLHGGISLILVTVLLWAPLWLGI